MRASKKSVQAQKNVVRSYKRKEITRAIGYRLAQINWMFCAPK
jgi:hypothetical protein